MSATAARTSCIFIMCQIFPETATFQKYEETKRLENDEKILD